MRRPQDRLSGLFDSKSLFVFGSDDAVVVAKQVVKEVKKILDDHKRLWIRTISGGHAFPVPSANDVVFHIENFWALN